MMDTFDYHQTSVSFPDQLRSFVQGPGFGGDQEAKVFPLRHTSPDTKALEMDIEHFSKSRNIGLATDADAQVPPSTLY